MSFASLEDRVVFYLDGMSPAERRVAKLILAAREEVPEGKHERRDRCTNG